MKHIALAGLLLIAFLFAMGAQKVQAATNSLTTLGMTGTIVGGTTNKISWALSFSPTTVYIMPHSYNLFVGQTKDARIIKLGSTATTNSPFDIVTISNTVSYLLEGHNELFVMSTNAAAISPAFTITIAR